MDPKRIQAKLGTNCVFHLHGVSIHARYFSDMNISAPSGHATPRLHFPVLPHPPWGRVIKHREKYARSAGDLRMKRINQERWKCEKCIKNWVVASHEQRPKLAQALEIKVAGPIAMIIEIYYTELC